MIATKTSPSAQARRKTARKASASDRVQLRINPMDKNIIARAAKMNRTTVSKFMLESSRQAAQEVFASQTKFVLNDEQWAAFCEAVDKPPRHNLTGLKRLLSAPSVFE